MINRAIPLLFAFAVIAIVLMPATACSAKSPHNELARTLKDVRSWAADSCLVADRWRQRSVPTHYALDTLRDAERGLEEQARGIAQQQGVDEGVRREATEAVSSVRRLCARLRRDIRSGDGAAAFSTCREMSRVRDALSRLAGAESVPR